MSKKEIAFYAIAIILAMICLIVAAVASVGGAVTAFQDSEWFLAGIFIILFFGAVASIPFTILALIDLKKQPIIK